MGYKNIITLLIIICVIVAAGFIGAIANYGSIIKEKENSITIKDSQIQTLINQKKQLQTWLEGNITLLNMLQIWLSENKTYYEDHINDVTAQVADLHAKIGELQSQMEFLKAPKLTAIGLKVEDHFLETLTSAFMVISSMKAHIPHITL